MGERVGYTRVSTLAQNLERHLDGVPVDRVFTDKASGKDVARSALEELLRFVGDGDTVVVHSLDRLGRNLDHLRRLVGELTGRRVRVEFVKEKDASTAASGGFPARVRVSRGRHMPRHRPRVPEGGRDDIFTAATPPDRPRSPGTAGGVGKDGTVSRPSLDKTPGDVAGMFDAVAHRYDLTNDVLSLGLDRLWRRATVRAVGALPGQRVLDIAAGTGTSAEPFAAAGVRVVAADFSLGMLRTGRAQRPNLAFTAADALRLPFADGSFDAVTMSFGLRNVVDTEAALREFLRVTRPGGRVVVCEFSHPVNDAFRAVYERYLMRALPVVARWVSSHPDSYRYLADTIQAWPDQGALARSFVAAGWADVRWRNLTGGVVALHRATKPANGAQRLLPAH